MILRIGTLVFLFLARLRFPSSKSIPKIIKDRYDETVLKLVCKFERIDLCCQKVDLCCRIRFEFFKVLFQKWFTIKVFTF